MAIAAFSKVDRFEHASIIKCKEVNSNR